MKSSFYQNNRGRLYEKLGDNFEIKIKGGNTDFLYLTGIERDDVAFEVKSDDGIIKETLYIPEYDPMKERWFGRMLKKSDVDFENVIEGEVPSFDMLIPELPSLRAIKSAEEIDRIKDAIELTAEGIFQIFETAKPGIYEYNIRAEFEKVLADNGCHEPAFDTIVGAGINSLCLHYPECDCLVNDGDLILLDLGAKVDGLCADISRVFPANGIYTDKQRALTNLACDAVDYVCENIKLGENNAKLNSLQNEYLAPRLKALGLDGELKDYVWHNISHHLGFDVHDTPDRNTPLDAGTVFTLEVGIYVESWGFGVRVEDDVLMTKNGCINLSSYIPRRAEEIEKFIADNT